METTKFDYVAVKIAAKILRAINHKDVRQKMLKVIEENKSIGVTDLYVKLRLEQSVASQHLAILREANVVKTKRDGKNINYLLNHDRIATIAGFVDNIEQLQEN